MLLALIALAMLFVAPASAATATPATVSLAGEHVRIGGTVTVTVLDQGVQTVATYTAETAGKLGYTLPVGSSGDKFVFQTANPLITDRNGDGITSTADLAISVADAIPAAVVPSNGVFTLQLTRDVASPIPFTVAYNSERIDTLTVKVTSTSDKTGFDLTLQETAAVSGVFSGTFETGAATVKTNATSPSATARPDIKVVDKDKVTVAYTDTEPLSLVSDTIVVDGLAPVVTVLSPAHNSFEQTFSSFLEARVTDADSGVDVSSIRFHYDGDGNNTFNEPGSVIPHDPSVTTTLATGVIARIPVPDSVTDGLRTWYVTANDISGTVGRSDAVATTAGNQAHIFTSDQNPPQVISAVAGEWYDTVAKKVKTGNRTSIRVVFSEKISVPSIVSGGFRLNGAPALSVQTYAALPNDVFMTVETYPLQTPVILLIDPGSISDLAGLQTSLVPVIVTDKIAPVLTLSFDKPATNTLIKIRVASDEVLAAPPSITINGLTRAAPTQIDEQLWELEFNVASLTGLNAGQGVKTVGAFGFDLANTLGTATPATFQVDYGLAPPLLTPTGAAPVTESFPDITASFVYEAAEYTGDTHSGVSLITATLDGEQVTQFMTTADAGATWILKGADVRPDGYEKGVYIFRVKGVDVAGNSHPEVLTVFEVAVDPPAPIVVPAEEEETGEVSAPPDEVTPDQESQPAEEPVSSGGNGATDGQTSDEELLPATTTTGSEEDLSAVTDDQPSEPTDTPEVDTPEDTDADATGEPAPEEEAVPAAETEAAPDVVEEPGDVTPVDPAEPSSVAAPVTQAVDATDVEADATAEATEPDTPAEAPEAPAEQNVDPVFDREAEQVGLDASGAVETGPDPDSVEESGTVFGCNLPLGNTNVVGGEYALLGVGLLGLAFRRPVSALRDLLSLEGSSGDSYHADGSA
ncbi:MAG: hypothetical protein QF554_09405 [Dehalococcoidia bacterium]|nr:hypothetical protein [Dehalococcoidia bacterium]